jgi:hypothetical protein
MHDRRDFELVEIQRNLRTHRIRIHPRDALEPFVAFSLLVREHPSRLGKYFAPIAGDDVVKRLEACREEPRRLRLVGCQLSGSLRLVGGASPFRSLLPKVEAHGDRQRRQSNELSS